MECQGAYGVDGVDSGLRMADVKPRASLDIKIAYALRDKETDCVIEVAELFEDRPFFTCVYEFE